MTGSKLSGLFNIPPQEKPGRTAFDTRPRAVESWVTTLPMANSGESARRIYTALREMNRLAISDSDRFKALEAFRQPVAHLTRVMKKHFVNQNLPLSPKSQKVAELAIQLQSEMALGYMCVIHDRLNKTFALPETHRLTTCVHRAIRYLSNILLFSYQIYIQHPEHVWLQIHRLYLYSEGAGLHNTMINDLNDRDAVTSSTIPSLYKQALLLALAGPYRLRQRIIDFVYNALELWAPKCRIYKLGEVPDTAGDESIFTINLNSDSAPGYFREESQFTNPVYSRLVDTGSLINILRAAIHAPETNDHLIPADILRSLLASWSGQSHRNFTRSPNTNNLTITLGLSATHHYIDEILRPMLSNPAGNCPAATEPLHSSASTIVLQNQVELDDPARYTSTPVFDISRIDDHTPDIWDPDYTYRATNRATNPIYSSRPSEIEAKSRRKQSLYAPLACKAVNESAGGYCLLGFLEYSKDAPKVQVGELVGIIDRVDMANTSLSLGIVRRIKNWKKGLELGIQKLAPCVDAIATAVIGPQGEYSKYHRSLALPEMSGLNQPATIITHTRNKVGDKLVANVNGVLTKIVLTTQLEDSGVFTQFEYRVIDEPDDGMRQAGDGSPEEFESVWNIL